MSEESVTDDEVLTAVASWRAFAMDGEKAMAEDAALMAICDQLYPSQPLDCGRQPIPIHFYGPGPRDRVKTYDPLVGTLHFARWRHELAGAADPLDNWHDQDEELLVFQGRRVRPTYTTTKRNPNRREVNYLHWERVPAELMKNVKAFPGSNATRAAYDEYLLNEEDFDAKNTEIIIRRILPTLNNRQKEEPRNIYPIGYKLLSRPSGANGRLEWTEGECLGVDPRRSDALKKHIGWFPKRLRRMKAGLGADPQDALWSQVFHGNLDVEAKEKFVPPKETWSTNPTKITTLTGSENVHSKLDILSLHALKACLPPAEPDTLEARTAWLETQATARQVHDLERNMATNLCAADRLRRPLLATLGVMTRDEPIGKREIIRTVEEIETIGMEKREGANMKKQEHCPKIPPKTGSGDESKISASEETRMTIRNSADKEREAIDAALEELSQNPESGQEGKRPIVVYLAFRSKLLGMPVTQVIGYEN